MSPVMKNGTGNSMRHTFFRIPLIPSLTYKSSDSSQEKRITACSLITEDEFYLHDSYALYERVKRTSQIEL
jgi:hypothetical protein